jgi:hypothetical protein
MADEQIVLTPEQRAELEQAVKVFQSEGQEFVKRYPELNDLLSKANERGLLMDNAALRKIITSGKRGVRLSLYLAQRENFDAATKLMNMKGKRAEEEVHRLLGWIDRNGFAVEYEPKVSETDAYLQKRKHEKKFGYIR